MICISSIESDVYNKKKMQMFVVNITFISSRALDEIKVIFTPNIWISSMYSRYAYIAFRENLHLFTGGPDSKKF